MGAGHADDDQVTVPRAAWEALLAEQAALRSRLDALEEATGPRPTMGVPAEPVAASDEGPPGIGRRRALIGLATAAAGGAVAAVAGADPAAAATGDVMRIGETNTGGDTTILTAAGSGETTLYVKNSGSPAVRAESLTNTGLVAYNKNTNYNYPTISAENESVGQALLLLSDGAHLRMLSYTSTIPPNENRSRSTNEIGTNSLGDLWHCVNGGTPGTWRKLSGRATAGALHVLPAPVRVYDSRPGTQPTAGIKSPLTANVVRSVDLKTNSAVPAGATAALVTVLLVNAANAAGNFTIWSNGAAKPVSNTLVWGGAAGRFTTSTVSAVDSGASVRVSASATTDLVLDVVGYYR